MESKELTIVIVTFKSRGKIFNCLNSIPKDIEVIIVENSNDLSLKKDIESKHQNVNYILSGDNKGYAVANNIGLNMVKTKYALVLNPDTVLDKDAINNFIISANRLNNFWLMGPANDQQIKNEFKNDNITEVENLKGFAIFFNLIKFKKKFFDENFFLYFEEIDLCRNVKINKGKIYLDKNIKIKHEGAGSVDKANKIELEKNRN